MCTYHGILEEYPLISIDSFETHNYTSTMFFITHIHMDHLVGLERPEFGRYVAKINASIYMSEISKQLLSTMAPYRHLIPYFKTVPIDQPFALTIQSNDPVQAKLKEGAANESLKSTLSSHAQNVGETILVTCFGSGHCPGSVMVWIEGEHGNVLFTGDFRLYRGQSKRITHLHRRRTDSDNKDETYIFKPINNLYIDMTFFRPDILHIPTREVSCEALILWIKGLVADKSNTANIYFKTSARVGYEQIYRALYDALGMRIHVEQGQYDFYSCLPIIQECLTTDPNTTRLHACRTSASNFAQPCSFFRNCDKPIRVLLSIMWFTDQIAAGELLVEYHKYHSNFEQSVSTSNKRFFIGFQDYGGDTIDVSYSDKYLSYRLCYSLHSSFSEIADVLKTLKPKRVTPIAAPFTSQMTPKRLFQIIDHYIQDPKSNTKTATMLTTMKLNEKIQRKPINQKLQIKHRYESFQTRSERKRKKKLMKEQQQRKDDNDELDLDIDNDTEKLLLQRVNSLKEVNTKKISTNDSKQIIRSISLQLPKIQDEKLKFESDSQVQTSIEPKFEANSQSSQIKSEETPNLLLTKDILPISIDHSIELLCTASNRERTLSDASSDTVDYDFDSETCTAFVSTSIDN
ncbi:unnamed protein product [Adineta steineri]|uniref:Protein artemis n=1 Tax=Adineta steineri TaxID=433720 RepID=A0A818GIH2_9BILA|nr:unnamed protein product [Adineta steineri]CAF3528755.1 unnamed protein product [Adineta steineri]CAF4175429.1 unnamed protein product [Adineta steineri]